MESSSIIFPKYSHDIKHLFTICQLRLKNKVFNDDFDWKLTLINRDFSNTQLRTKC